MSDPFDGYRVARNHHTRNHHANKWIGNTQKTQRTRTKTVPMTFFADPDLIEWIKDRATLMGVAYTHLLRDVLVEWRNLVISTENKLGLNLDGVRKEFAVEERLPGYAGSLVPSAAHTDAAPLGLGEL